jgi:fatty-acyl-CoA synthase
MFKLNIRHIIWRAAKLFGRKQLVEWRGDGNYARVTYNEFERSVKVLASALSSKFSLRKGERIASMCWNTLNHMVLHFAVPLSGLVLHTVNLRFSDEQIAYSINKAGDKVVFADPDTLPTIQRIAPKLETVEKIVVTGPAERVHGVDVVDLQDLLKNVGADLELSDPDENDPALMCFTTGTTGAPKGVVYTHRGVFLRALSTGLADTYALSEADTVLHVVPMYHISSWFIPYAAALFGSKQVFPGPHPTPKRILEIVLDEGVTVSDGVPTVWLDVLNFARSLNVKGFGGLRRLIVGGSAVPEALIRSYHELGVEIIHAWGMTETYDSAVATYIKSYLRGKSEDEVRLRKKQGLPFPCIEVDLIDETGRRQPWDGKAVGELIIRGAWVIDSYYGKPSYDREGFVDGWFRTGDVVTIDREGYVEVVDRLKDLIRSGGEWISTVELENAIMGHPAVREAAVVGVKHPRWGERPIGLVTLKEGQALSKQELVDYLSRKFPKFWIPDEFIFVESVPKTSVGKFDKKHIRKMFENFFSGRDAGQP